MAPPDPSVVRIDGPWRHLEVHANGIRFHVVEAESAQAATSPSGSGPLVILLHGFPEFWYCWWKDQLEHFCRSYRVVAPDMRGYNLSEKPP